MGYRSERDLGRLEIDGGPEVLERETGIEPATNGLGSRYSTIELLPLVRLIIELLPSK